MSRGKTNKRETATERSQFKQAASCCHLFPCRLFTR